MYLQEITLILKISENTDPELVNAVTRLVASLVASGEHADLEVIAGPEYDETDFVRIRDLKKFLKTTGLKGFNVKAQQVWFFFSKEDFKKNPSLLIVCRSCEKQARQCKCEYPWQHEWMIGKQSLLRATAEVFEDMSPESRDRLMMFIEHLRDQEEQL